jgi:hypothetical protein
MGSYQHMRYGQKKGGCGGGESYVFLLKDFEAEK